MPVLPCFTLPRLAVLTHTVSSFRGTLCLHHYLCVRHFVDWVEQPVRDFGSSLVIEYEATKTIGTFCPA